MVEIPMPKLFSFPSLYYKDDEVVIASADGRQIPIEGQLLGAKRSVEECRYCLST